MPDLKIALWNCSGLRSSAAFTAHKMGFFDKEFPDAHFGLAIFVETHHRGEDDFPELIKEYKHTHHILHTPTPPHHTHSGVIVLLRKDFEIISTTIKIPGRLLNVKFKDKIENKNYNLSAFYGPIIKTILKKDLNTLVQNFYDVHRKCDNNIIIGDFNFIDNNFDKNNGMDSHDKKISSIWEDFKQKVNVVDPFRDHYPTTNFFSYVTSNARSQLDRIYVTGDHVICVRDNIFIIPILIPIS